MAIDIEVLLSEYEEHLFIEGLAETTIRHYVSVLRRAHEWARSEGAELLTLTGREVATLSEQFPKTNSSRRLLRSALVHLWSLHGVSGPRKAIRVPPRPRPRWRGLEDDQVRALLKAAAGDWPRGAVIYLGLYLALRREEIATLRWSDFDADLEWVTIVGKSDRTRHLPVHPVCRQMLDKARFVLRSRSEWVFQGRLDGHITLTSINNWVSEMGELAGIGHIHPHQLRHTSGGKVNDTTEDIYAAQGWLGHAHIETTEVYTRRTAERLRKAMLALDWSQPDDGSNVIDFPRRGEAS